MTSKTLAETLKNYKTTLKTLGFTLAKQPNLYPAIQKNNPLQISAITEKKIIGLLENTGTVIDPKNQEHREKYFSAIKPYKFIFQMVESNTETNNQLLEQVANNFLDDFTKGVELSFNWYENRNIATIYNMQPNELNDNGKRSYITRGVSCMQGKNKNLFEAYEKTKFLKLCTLEDDNGNLYGRALLWANNGGKYYLDRIYIADSLCSNDKIKATYQQQLYDKVLFYLNTKDLNCYSLRHIQHSDNSNCSIPSEFIPQLEKGVEPLDFDQYPYGDTFKGLDSGGWYEDGHGADILLDQTDGGNGNEERATCEECNDRVHEDDIHYSQVDEEYLCEDCASYCDERDDYINSNNAICNDYTGTTHHRNDLNLN